MEIVPADLLGQSFIKLMKQNLVYEKGCVYGSFRAKEIAKNLEQVATKVFDGKNYYSHRSLTHLLFVHPLAKLFARWEPLNCS